MRAFPPRFTLASTMVAVVLAGLAIAFGKATTVFLKLFLIHRNWLVGSATYALLVVAVTLVAVAPFVAAAWLILRATARGPGRRGWTPRRVLGIVAWVGLGLALARSTWPWPYISTAWRLRDGTLVLYHEEFRVWPGREVTPCLDLIPPVGRPRRIYAIAPTIAYLSWPDLRTNQDQTVIWLTEDPTHRTRPDGVFCSLDRRAGQFVGLTGTHPAGVSATTGFPPTP